jgi:predicted dehydrogenase
MTRTRVGLVGCGVISSTYATTLTELDFVDLVVCADLDAERSAKLAENHGIPETGSLDDVLARDDLDIVLNLTPPLAHAEVTGAAIASGTSVFSEKPLAITLAEGRVLHAAAAAVDVRFGCAPDTFLGVGLQTCRDAIDRGDIGEPIGANAFMLSPGPERWHPSPSIFYARGAGPLFDMGPYYLTALIHLLGPVARVTAAARRHRPERPILSEPQRGELIPVEVPTHVATLLEFESGPIATLVTSFDVAASRYRHIEIYGTDATLSVPDPNTFGGPVKLRRVGDTEWNEVPLREATIPQRRGIGLADMAWAVRTGRPHRASSELALHVLDVMDRTVAAAEAGVRIDLETSCERPAPMPAGLPVNEFDD